MDWINLPRRRGLAGEDLDGKGRYGVVDPSDLYHGKSYSEWTSDWLNWFLSADADRRNSGPVVCLRSKGLPNEKTGANISDIPAVPGEASVSDTLPGSTAGDVTGMIGYSKTYVNDPNVKVGGDRLQIFEDQAVFVPIIVAFWLKTSPYADWGGMLDYTGLTIDYGDNPPDISQLTINGMEIDLPITDEIKKEEENRLDELDKLKKEEEEILDNIKDIGEKLDEIKEEQQITAPIKKKQEEMLRNIKEKGEELDRKKEKKINLARGLRLMQPFRITTPIFTAIVPEAQYGRSAKDFIEETPIASGSYPAMVDGYFVMLKFKEGTYWVHSWASGPRETRGPYFSELLYEIEVQKRTRPYGRVTEWRPSRNERVLNQILEQKKRMGDLTKGEMNRFKTYFTTEDKSERKSLVPKTQV
jgi:hypothetical protein